MRLNRNLKEEMIIKHFRISHAGLNCHANYKTKHDTREFAGKQIWECLYSPNKSSEKHWVNSENLVCFLIFFSIFCPLSSPVGGGNAPLSLSQPSLKPKEEEKFGKFYKTTNRKCCRVKDPKHSWRSFVVLRLGGKRSSIYKQAAGYC